jgi:hypothetical protein
MYKPELLKLTVDGLHCFSGTLELIITRYSKSEDMLFTTGWCLYVLIYTGIAACYIVVILRKLCSLCKIVFRAPSSQYWIMRTLFASQSHATRRVDCAR